MGGYIPEPTTSGCFWGTDPVKKDACLVNGEPGNANRSNNSNLKPPYEASAGRKQHLSAYLSHYQCLLQARTVSLVPYHVHRKCPEKLANEKGLYSLHWPFFWVAIQCKSVPTARTYLAHPYSPSKSESNTTSGTLPSHSRPGLLVISSYSIKWIPQGIYPKYTIT